MFDEYSVVGGVSARKIKDRPFFDDKRVLVDEQAGTV